MTKKDKSKKDFDALSLSNPFQQFSINSSSGSNDDQLDLPSDLVLILKKYNKKDPNTRQRAVSDLLDYCCTNWSIEKSDSICKALKMYFGKFVQDPERSIRVESLKLLSFLIEKDKQKIQLIFQHLIYPLLTCMFDPNKTVIQTCNQLIIEKYFNSSEKFYNLISKFKDKIIEGLRNALNEKNTFEEITYEPSESDFMSERRKGCSFFVFNLLVKQLEIKDVSLIGSVNDIRSILVSLSGKPFTFLKRSILTCFDDNFDLFEPNNLFSTEIFLLTVQSDDGIDYLNLIFKYLPCWIKEQKKETQIYKFIMSNFQIINLITEKIDQVFLKKFSLSLLKDSKAVLPKYFFSLLNLQLNFENNVEQLLNDFYCKSTIIPVHLINKLESKITYDHLIEYFSSHAEQLKNVSFFCWTLQEMSRFDEEKTAVFVSQLNFDHFKMQDKFYFFIISQYPELASRLNFDDITLDKRIDQLKYLKINDRFFAHLFPSSYEFTIEQKIQLLNLVDIELLWDWKNNLFLFHQLLGCCDDEILLKFSLPPFLIQYFLNYFDIENDSILEKICLFPIEIQFLVCLLYGKPFIVGDSLVKFQLNVELIIEVIKPFLLSELIHFDLLLLVQFFRSVSSDIFLKIWSFLFETNIQLIDDYVIQIALDLEINTDQFNSDISVLESRRKRRFTLASKNAQLGDLSELENPNLLLLLDSYPTINEIPGEIISKLPTVKAEFSSLDDLKVNFYSNCKNENSYEHLSRVFFDQLINFIPIDPSNNTFLTNYLSIVREDCFEVENALLLLLNCNLEIVQLKMFELLNSKSSIDENLSTYLVEPFIKANSDKRECRLQILMLIYLFPTTLLTVNLELMEQILEHLFYSINLLKFTFDPSHRTLCSIINYCSFKMDITKREFGEFLFESQIIIKLLTTCNSFVRNCLNGSQVGISYSSKQRFLFSHHPIHLRRWIEERVKQFKYESLGSWFKEQISPWFVKEELENVSRNTNGKPITSTGQGSKMTIKTIISSQLKSLQAIYQIEDVKMELSLILPSDYPLSPVSISTGTRVGVTERVWRAWLLSTKTVLTTGATGKLFDALMLWKANADKRFEGVEDCTICVSIFHPTDKSLPTQQCRTCNQKFHSGCIYKWFSTSANSTCPLCRSYFY